MVSSLTQQSVPEPHDSHEPVARRVAKTKMPSKFGTLTVVAFHSSIGDILAVVNGLGDGRDVPVRVHDACLTGEVLGSLKCDCGLQLQMALEVQRRKQLGVIIYMPQEGRGIGLANKIAAYYLQEEHGLDTVDANLALGLPAEMRSYAPVQSVIEDLGIYSILLMTNNPYKVKQLQEAGVRVNGTIPLHAAPQAAEMHQYLEVKRKRMGHLLPNHIHQAPCPPHSFGPNWEEAMRLISTLQAKTASFYSERPFTLLTFATSMDGFIGRICVGADGTTSQSAAALSGQASMTLTHHLRGCVDAILVGVGTVLTDDPKLDVRVDGAGSSPQPVVLDSHLRTPASCRLLTHKVAGGRHPLIVMCTDAADSARAEVLRAAGAIVIRCRSDALTGRIDIFDAWARLGQLGVKSLMVEGGAEVIKMLLQKPTSSLVNFAIITKAPTMLGQGVSWTADGCARLTDVNSFILGNDAVFTGQLSQRA